MIYGTPPIVTSGSILNLDATNTRSYVSGSTIWRDLSGDNNIVPLTSSIYSPQGGGTIFRSDSVALVNLYNTNTNISGSTNLTIELAFYWNGVDFSNSYGAFGNYGGPNSLISFYKNAGQGATDSLWWLFHWQDATGSLAGNTISVATVPFIRNSFNHTTVSVKDDGRFTVTANGRVISNTIVSNFGRWRITNSTFAVGGVNAPGFGANVVRIYNRYLSINESLQNYNALKSRLNLI